MKSYRSIVLVAAACLVCASVFAQDSTDTNVLSDATGEPGTLKWTFTAPRGFGGSPALSADGKLLYAVSANGTVYAFTNEVETLTNEPAWTFALHAPVAGSPVLDEDGNLYVTSRNGHLYSVTPFYGSNWKYPGRGRVGPMTASPAIDEDGTVYIATLDGLLHAVTPSEDQGGKKWSFYARYRMPNAPLVGSDGVVYITPDAKVIGVATNGSQAFTYKARKTITSAPAMSASGILYFGDDDESLYSLDPHSSTNGGGFRWRYKTGRIIYSSPAIGAGGQIYVGGGNGRIYCFGPGGDVRWTVSGVGAARGAVAIGADGTIYAGSENGKLYAITPDGKKKWTFATGTRIRSSPVIGRDGTVYVTAGRRIFALYDNAATDDEVDPWPMFRRDAQNTALATNGAPFIVANLPEELVVDAGTNVELTVKVAAAVPVTYQWLFNDEPIDRADNPTANKATLQINNVAPADAGRYSVVVSNEFGSATSSEVNLIVATHPIFVSDLTNRFVSTNAPVELSVSALGFPEFSAQWYKDNVPIPGATSLTLFITNTAPGSNLYYVVLTNSQGTSTSHVASVVVVDLHLARDLKTIGAGNGFSAAIVTNELFTWGADTTGQLADGGATSRNVPTRSSTNTQWSGVAAGGRGSLISSNRAFAHALAVRTNGTLFAWGANAQGQVGNGGTNEERVPVQIGSDTNWVQVEAGAAHTVGLKIDGTLWAWGANESGQLGLGTSNSVRVPTRVGLDSAWVEVRAGGSFTLARRADNTLWAWGKNDSGQLGVGTTNNVRAPVQIGSNAVWSTISAGVAHSLGIQTDGSLWAWGRNFGLRTDKTYSATNVFRTPVRVGDRNDWAAVDAGYDHSLAINSSGAMFSWGANNVGQLGNGITGPTSGQTNQNNVADPTQIAAGRTWRAIEAGVKHSLATATDGSVWAWGWNNFGQIGDGTGGDGTDAFNRSVPVQVVFTNFVAVATNAGPIITSVAPASLAVAAGTNASFTVTGSGSNLAYQWLFNNTNILTGATNATLTILNVQATNAGSYLVIVTNTLGSATSAPVTLTVSNSPPVITQQSSDKTFIEGTSNVLRVIAVGDQPLAYQWRFFPESSSGGGPVEGGTNAILVLNPFTSTNVGYYSVTVTNRFGSVSGTPIHVTLSSITPPGGGSNQLSSITLLPVVVGTNRVVVPLQANSQIFILEYKDRIENATWMPLSTNEGLNTLMEIVDPAPPGTSRFYRVRVP